MQLAKLKQDYLFSEQTSVSMKFFDEAENKYVDGPVASVPATFGATFNLNSIQVDSANGSLSLDGANIINLIFTFKCFNEVLCKRINLSHCLVCQFGIQEISQLLSSSQNSLQDNTSFVQNYRLFDFSPYQLCDASIDTTGNLGVELFSTPVYKYLLTQFSELVQLRFDIQNKQKIVFNQG